jgi:translocation protein SEC66
VARFGLITSTDSFFTDLYFDSFFVAINDAEPWFGEHIPRNQYIALLQQTEPEATDNQLMAALLRRAMEDVGRVLSMREDKAVLANLVKQGAVGDDIWTQFTLSERELDAEVRAVIEEAETFKDGWSQTILQTASEMVKKKKKENIDPMALQKL